MANQSVARKQRGRFRGLPSPIALHRFYCVLAPPSDSRFGDGSLATRPILPPLPLKIPTAVDFIVGRQQNAACFAALPELRSACSRSTPANSKKISRLLAGRIPISWRDRGNSKRIVLSSWLVRVARSCILRGASPSAPHLVCQSDLTKIPLHLRQTRSKEYPNPATALNAGDL